MVHRQPKVRKENVPYLCRKTKPGGNMTDNQPSEIKPDLFWLPEHQREPALLRLAQQQPPIDTPTVEEQIAPPPTWGEVITNFFRLIDGGLRIAGEIVLAVLSNPVAMIIVVIATALVFGRFA